MAEEAKAEEKIVDEFALVVDGKQQYPKIVDQKIENNKIVSAVVVNTPEEHKKWLKDNKPAEDQSKIPAWGKK